MSVKVLIAWARSSFLAFTTPICAMTMAAISRGSVITLRGCASAADGVAAGVGVGAVVAAAALIGSFMSSPFGREGALCAPCLCFRDVEDALTALRSVLHACSTC